MQNFILFVVKGMPVATLVLGIAGAGVYYQNMTVAFLALAIGFPTVFPGLFIMTAGGFGLLGIGTEVSMTLGGLLTFIGMSINCSFLLNSYKIVGKSYKAINSPKKPNKSH